MSDKRRFKHWAYLNDKGKEIFGEVFPDGIVPVVCLLSVATAPTGDAAYLLYHEEMTPEQTDKLLTILAKRFNAPKEDVEAQMLKDRIPLRRTLTNGSGTDGTALFI